jgi:TctA family transporter
MMMSQGDLSIFFHGPIAAVLLTVGLVVIFYPAFRYAFLAVRRGARKSHI